MTVYAIIQKKLSSQEIRQRAYHPPHNIHYPTKMQKMSTPLNKDFTPNS
jgi:hypothetical protein